MPWLKVCLLAVLTFSAYSFMLSAPFKTLDDQYSIVGNALIKDTSQWSRLFTQGYFQDRTYYRPLVNLSFMAEYKMFGLDAFYYNLDNVLIHLVNVFLVWALVSLLVGAEISFWTALLFAIHPIQWEAVANISGRAILLSTMFSLGAFIAYLRARHITAVFLFIAALLCKESAAVLPGILFVHGLINRKDLRWLGLWGVVIAGYVALRHYLGITEFFPWRNLNEHILGILTFARSVITDLRLLILPVDLHFDRSREMFRSINDAGALMTIFVWVTALCWLGVARTKLTSMHWLCLAWFALCLLPVSQIVTTIGVQPGVLSTAEHFLYVACVPVFIVVVDALLKVRIPAVKIGACGILVFFFFTTIEQNIYAQHELSMVERSLRIQPRNARLQSSAGLVYALAEKFLEAEMHFRAAVANDPLNPRYMISLGKSICDQGRLVECLDVYDHIKDPGRLGELLKKNRKAALELLQKQQQ